MQLAMALYNSTFLIPCGIQFICLSAMTQLWPRDEGHFIAELHSEFYLMPLILLLITITRSINTVRGLITSYS